MNQIIDRFLSELINEYVIRLNHSPEHKSRSDRTVELSIKLQAILSRLSSEDVEIITAYIDESAALAEMDCKFLYIKGVIDCIKLITLIEEI